MNERRSISLEVLARSIDDLAEDVRKLPELTLQVNTLINKMDEATKHFDKMERIATSTGTHSTTLKLLGATVIILLPLLVTWNVYLAKQIQELTLQITVANMQIVQLRRDTDANSVNKAPTK
jgi:hypothetical protein